MNHLLLVLSAFVVAASAIPASLLCKDGWTRYEDSCYYMERDEKMTYHQAEQRCHDKGATLFVPNSIQEYKTIIMNAPLNYWTWIGLYKESETSTPLWESSTDLDFKDLDWINKPFGNAVNGWTTVSQCAAHWNPSTEIGKYAFFYPCSYSFYFVCERNQTLSAH